MKRLIPLLVFIFINILNSCDYAEASVVIDVSKYKTDEEELVLDRIIVFGNHKFEDQEIIDITSWKIGEPFSEHDLSQGTNKLEDTGYFKKVDASTRKGSEPGLVIVVLKVRERAVPWIQFFQHDVNWNGWEFNLFEIRSNTLEEHAGITVEAVIFSEWDGVRFKAEKPLKDKKDSSFLIFGGIEDNRFVEWPQNRDDKGFHQEFTRSQINAGFKRYINEEVEITFSAGLEHYELDDEIKIFEGTNWPEDEDSEYSSYMNSLCALMDSEDNDWLTFKFIYQYDSRDDHDYPSKGHWFKIPLGLYVSLDELLREETECSPAYASYGVNQNSDNGRLFTQFDIDYRSYSNYFDHNVFALRARVAGVSSNAPYFIRPVFSRAFTLRGYPYGWADLGAKTLGLAQFSMEYRFPVLGSNPKPFLMGYLFMDTGITYRDDTIDYDLTTLESSNNNKISNLLVTLGWGLAVKIPFIGPLAISSGFPVSYDNDNKPPNLLVSIKMGLAF